MGSSLEVGRDCRLAKRCPLGHSIHIRTGSSQHLLSALLNWLKPVYRLLKQGIMHRPYSIYAQTSQEGIKCTKTKSLLS